MDAKDLQKHISSTYFSLRIGIATLSIVFPLILLLGGLIQSVELQDSMSAYYHAAEGLMRDWFVGILFAVGVFLYSYKGYTVGENVFLNLAGMFAVGIAIFPMEWGCAEVCSKITLHGICAVSFFICIAIVCIFYASKTLQLFKDAVREKKFKITYQLLGCAMVLLPLSAFLSQYFLNDFPYVFVAEALGVWVFSTYWLVKSYEIKITNSERRAMESHLAV